MSHGRRDGGGARAGVIVLMLLVVLGAVTVVVCEGLSGFGVRLRQAGARLARVQGRELALGAIALAPGTTTTVGVWTVAHERDAAGDHYRAVGPGGMFTIDAAADGAAQERWVETWQRRPAAVRWTPEGGFAPGGAPVTEMSAPAASATAPAAAPGGGP
jgi:hypothetical protein